MTEITDKERRILICYYGHALEELSVGAKPHKMVDKEKLREIALRSLAWIETLNH